MKSNPENPPLLSYESFSTRQLEKLSTLYLSKGLQIPQEILLIIQARQSLTDQSHIEQPKLSQVEKKSKRSKNNRFQY